MSAKNSLIEKISDFLENRQKNNNFGTCRKCQKNVYWSTTKIASHIRSGHCKGASMEEVQKFKQEFVYESPKHLIHRSFVGKTESKEKESVVIKKVYVKHEGTNSSATKRQKLEYEVEDADNEQQYRLIEENNDNEDIMYELEAANTDDEKSEQIIYVTNEPPQESTPKIHIESISNEQMKIPPNKEEKFIAAVYPQYKGRTKLQLIDEIFDLQRRNELLQNKVKTYEDTINKLL